GNKFQFKQGSVDDVEADADAQQAESPDPQTADTATTGDPDPEPSPDPEPTADADATDAELLDSDPADGESPAQSSARSDVVSPDELPDSRPDAASTADADEPTTESEPTAESSSLDQLRSELNDQFESIRIVSPGEYELNLMELYDRNEYIISLREDGRYIIEVPDSWDTDMPS
ncbi:MAG: Zn-ribbon containing protein, partial [Halonotius sp.]